MRVVSLLLAVAACSSSATTPVASPTTPEELLAPGAVLVLRSRPDLFIPLAYTKELFAHVPVPACWTDLESNLVAGWQIQLPGADGRRTSYFLLEGDLPRALIATCIPAALAPIIPMTAHDVGDLLELDDGMGRKTYAAWRGRFIVVGSRDLVTAATTPTTPAIRARWHQAITSALAHPGAPTWAASFDDIALDLFGPKAISFQFVIDTLSHEPQKLVGRVIATYGTAADAATAATRVKEAKLSLPASPALLAALGQLKVTQDGLVVTVGFDYAMFSAVSQADVAALIGTLAAGG